MKAFVYAPVVSGGTDAQVAPFVRLGFIDVLRQIPRAEMEAGKPKEETVAPGVALEEVIPITVGDVTVGTEAQILPFQVEPEVQVAVAVAWLRRVELLYK
jgi:hypothetical protein